MTPQLSLNKIKGVGPVLDKQFKAAGLETVADLAYFFPRRYEDYSNTRSIKDIEPGRVTLKADVEQVTTKRMRRNMHLTTAVLNDSTGKIQAVWFNQPYRAQQLKQGGPFFFTGNYEFKYNRFQLTSPSVEQAKEHMDNLDKLVPIYSKPSGLKTQYVRKTLENMRTAFSTWPEELPKSVVESARLISLGAALEKIHFPASPLDAQVARERLAFQELFELILASQLNKHDNHKLKGWQVPFNKEAVLGLVKQLPFKLTPGQRIAAWEIIQDFAKPFPMNRLLQGDVGSGKTVVAGIAATQAAASDLQTAILAPTDILATQHAQTLQQLLKPIGVNVGLLTGRVKGEARKVLYQQIKDGHAQVVVGTHALLQEGLTFKQLGLVVVDEQHRFGVKQRQELLNKSKHLPHLLTMTATPIPRSLALTVYGELEVSILPELPGGRLPIKTKIWSPSSPEDLFNTVRKELQAGRQAYYICNLIEETNTSSPNHEAGEEIEIKNVEKQYKLLKSKYFKDYTVGMLHGKMKPKEKQAVMDSFSKGDINILVSTTVVEVGVDVPNASTIVIENADRFGLAQLHQLRGRVGRGKYQSYAHLINSDSGHPTQRLRELEKSNDGFYLAEADLRLRGPGEIYGKSQHGALNLKIATLANSKEINKAKNQALRFIKSGEKLADYPQLAQKIKKYQRITTLN